MLSTAFDSKRNSLNALRLFLAVTVIVSHSWPVGGFGKDPRWGDQNLGEWAVGGFFVISGYLILGSRLRSTSLADYFWRRFLRIYPAFIVCLSVIAFLFAPLSLALAQTGPYDFIDAIGYVIKNLGLLIVQPGIEGTLTHVPFPNTWDAPLWTLFYEFTCYVWIGILVSILPKKWLLFALIVIGLICISFGLLGMESNWDLTSRIARFCRLSGYFASGAILYCVADRLPARWYLAAIAGVFVLISMPVSLFHIFAGFPLAYLLIYLGAKLPMSRIGARNDVSYGMYIWAFPIQQLLVIVLPLENMNPYLFATISIAMTLPMAWVSWLIIERPAMSLKRFPRKATNVRI